MTDTATRPQRGRRSATPSPAAVAPAPATEPVAASATAPAPASAENHGMPARRARRPYGSRRQRLENPPIPGFQCYWFNDTPGRIDWAKECGWEHVLDDDGKPVKHPVGVAATGGALHAYRMKIPREWYEEDQAAKEEPRRQIDADMRRSIKDGGYAQEGRPGYTSSTVSANMTADGRQTFGTRSQT